MQVSETNFLQLNDPKQGTGGEIVPVVNPDGWIGDFEVENNMKIYHAVRYLGMIFKVP